MPNTQSLPQKPSLATSEMPVTFDQNYARLVSLIPRGRMTATLNRLNNLNFNIPSVSFPTSPTPASFDQNFAYLATFIPRGYIASNLNNLDNMNFPRLSRFEHYVDYGWQQRYDSSRKELNLSYVFGPSRHITQQDMAALATILKRLPPEITKLIFRNTVCYTKPDPEASLLPLTGIPAGVTTLDLRGIGLHHLSVEQLQSCANALSFIKKWHLASEEIDAMSPLQLTALLAIAPNALNVERFFYSKDHDAAARGGMFANTCQQKIETVVESTLCFHDTDFEDAAAQSQTRARPRPA